MLKPAFSLSRTYIIMIHVAVNVSNSKLQIKQMKTIY